LLPLKLKLTCSPKTDPATMRVRIQMLVPSLKVIALMETRSSI